MARPFGAMLLGVTALLWGVSSIARADIFGIWGVSPPRCTPEGSDDDAPEDKPALHGRGTLWKWSDDGESGGPDINKPLVADRPDFTEGATTVGWGITQAEMGYTFTHDSQAGTTHSKNSYPELLLRQGMLADWFELRIGWSLDLDGLQGLTLPGSQQNRASDLNIGCKMMLTAQQKWLPQTGLLLDMDVPTSGQPGGVLPEAAFLYGWELSERVGLNCETAVKVQVDDDSQADYLQFAQSMSLDLKLTEQVGAFFEGYALLPAGADSALPQYYLDSGLTYLVNNNVQLDIRVGTGLNGPADNLFAGAGVSVRH